MKTSQKLLIPLVSIFVVLLLAAPILMKKPANISSIKNTSYLKEVKTLPAFNHIKIANNSCLEISNTKTGENSIIYSFPEDTVIEEINFTLVGDTLILPYQDTPDKQSFKIKCNEVKSISCAVPLTIDKTQDTLNVYSESGQIIIRSEHFKQLNLIGTGGAFRTLQPLVVDELNVDLYNTRLRFYNVAINKLNAKMEYESEIVIQNAKVLQVKKDESCHFEEY